MWPSLLCPALSQVVTVCVCGDSARDFVETMNQQDGAACRKDCGIAFIGLTSSLN